LQLALSTGSSPGDELSNKLRDALGAIIKDIRKPNLMPLSALLAGVIAAVVGCGGSIAIVLSAATAVGASAGQTASWITALCFAMAVTTGLLSVAYRMPIVTAWSTPGAALITASAATSAATSVGGLGLESAIGAFIVAAGLILLASIIQPLTRLIERLPMPIASAMLAGVLLKLVIAPFDLIAAAPGLILSMFAVFLLVRLWNPSLAVIAVLVAGIGLSAAFGLLKPFGRLEFAHLEWVSPRFEPSVMLGLGVPLFLVTMASQNLAGFAVLRASGYDTVPGRSILGVTGLASLVTAPLGAHTSNLAAISAAICTGPDCHPDKTLRWWSGVAYGLSYLVLGLIGPSLVMVFAALPAALMKTVAGVALAGPLLASLAAAFGPEPAGGTTQSTDKLAPLLTFLVTASSLSIAGVGSAFWGLIAGLSVVALGRLNAR
jgi:benzoate membrane transport protein